jgi:hypothetical protein
MSILEFKEVLESLKKEHDYDDEPYDVGRITHCYLVTTRNGVEHKFDVRGWSLKDNILSVSAVNWTMIAGSCVIELTDSNVKDWRIEDDGFNRIL